MLHIVNKSPYERNTLDAVLRIAQDGSLLLIEDGVYAATRGSAAKRSSRPPWRVSRCTRCCRTSRRAPSPTGSSPE